LILFSPENPILYFVKTLGKIHTTPMKGMTFADSDNDFAKSLNKPILSQDFYAVMGTAWIKAAARTKCRRNTPPINLNQEHKATNTKFV
jgi:hypothetical protein